MGCHGSSSAVASASILGSKRVSAKYGEDSGTSPEDWTDAGVSPRKQASPPCKVETPPCKPNSSPYRNTPSPHPPPPAEERPRESGQTGNSQSNLHSYSSGASAAHRSKPPVVHTREELCRLSIKQLKEIVLAQGEDPSAFLEKAELVEAAWCCLEKNASKCKAQERDDDKENQHNIQADMESASRTSPYQQSGDLHRSQASSAALNAAQIDSQEPAESMTPEATEDAVEDAVAAAAAAAALDADADDAVAAVRIHCEAAIEAAAARLARTWSQLEAEVAEVEGKPAVSNAVATRNVFELIDAAMELKRAGTPVSQKIQKLAFEASMAEEAWLVRKSILDAAVRGDADDVELWSEQAKLAGQDVSVELAYAAMLRFAAEDQGVESQVEAGENEHTGTDAIPGKSDKYSPEVAEDEGMQPLRSSGLGLGLGSHDGKVQAERGPEAIQKSLDSGSCLSADNSNAQRGAAPYSVGRDDLRAHGREALSTKPPALQGRYQAFWQPQAEAKAASGPASSAEAEQSSEYTFQGGQRKREEAARPSRYADFWSANGRPETAKASAQDEAMGSGIGADRTEATSSSYAFSAGGMKREDPRAGAQPGATRYADFWGSPSSTPSPSGPSPAAGQQSKASSAKPSAAPTSSEPSSTSWVPPPSGVPPPKTPQPPKPPSEPPPMPTRPPPTSKPPPPPPTRSSRRESASPSANSCTDEPWIRRPAPPQRPESGAGKNSKWDRKKWEASGGVTAADVPGGPVGSSVGPRGRVRLLDFLQAKSYEPSFGKANGGDRPDMPRKQQPPKPPEELPRQPEQPRTSSKSKQAAQPPPPPKAPPRPPPSTPPKPEDSKQRTSWRRQGASPSPTASANAGPRTPSPRPWASDSSPGQQQRQSASNKKHDGAATGSTKKQKSSWWRGGGGFTAGFDKFRESRDRARENWERAKQEREEEEQKQREEHKFWEEQHQYFQRQKERPGSYRQGRASTGSSGGAGAGSNSAGQSAGGRSASAEAPPPRRPPPPRPTSRSDYLGLLGFSADADPSEDDLRKAYRKMAMKWHPDRPHNRECAEEATEMFKAAKEAYDYFMEEFKRN